MPHFLFFLMFLSVCAYIAKDMSCVCSALAAALISEPVCTGITVHKLRNLLNIFVALLGKKKPTIKQNPGYSKACRRRKNKVHLWRRKNWLKVATVFPNRLFQQRAVPALCALMSPDCTITSSTKLWMHKAGLSTSFQLSEFVIGGWSGTVNRFWNTCVKLQ